MKYIVSYLSVAPVMEEYECPFKWPSMSFVEHWLKNHPETVIVGCWPLREEKAKVIPKESDDFEKVWRLYNKRGSKKKSRERWGKLSAEDRETVMKIIPLYKERHGDMVANLEGILNKGGTRGFDRWLWLLEKNKPEPKRLIR